MIDSVDFQVYEISTFFHHKFTDTKNFHAFCVLLLRTCMSPKFISCEVGSERMTREDIKKTLCQPPVGLDTIRQFLLSRGRIFPTVKSYFRCCAIFPLSQTLHARQSSSLINEVSSDIPFSSFEFNKGDRIKCQDAFFAGLIVEKFMSIVKNGPG